MNEVNHEYGPLQNVTDPNSRVPLDWRHPDVHAIYWAIKGLRAAGHKTVGEDFSADEANTDRIVAHSLQNLFHYGSLFFYKTPRIVQQPQDESIIPSDQNEPSANEYVFIRPDLRMFDAYNRAITDIIEKYSEPDRTFDSSYQVGHRNMLKDAVFLFYISGHRGEAAYVYKKLIQIYPHKEDPKIPLDNFVHSVLTDKMENITIRSARELISMMLREAYFRYAMRDDDEAFAREQMAEQVHRDYQKAYSDEIRIELPPFEVMRYNSLVDFFRDRQYPAELRQALITRIKIERPDLAERFNKIEEEMRQEAQNRE
jgi:hypothetical protein